MNHLRILVARAPRPGRACPRRAVGGRADPRGRHRRRCARCRASASAYDALTRMRREHTQLATVVDGDRLLRVVTLDDLLREVLPA